MSTHKALAARCLSHQQAASGQPAIRALPRSPLRRLALSVLFTIVTNSYQTTCTVSERSSIKGTRQCKPTTCRLLALRQVASRMFIKYLSLPSKYNVNIYNRVYIWLDDGKNLQWPSKLQDEWSKMVFDHHPMDLDGVEKPFATIQILMWILKLMRATNGFLLTLEPQTSRS